MPLSSPNTSTFMSCWRGFDLHSKALPCLHWPLTLEEKVPGMGHFVQNPPPILQMTWSDFALRERITLVRSSGLQWDLNTEPRMKASAENCVSFPWIAMEMILSKDVWCWRERKTYAQNTKTQNIRSVHEQASFHENTSVWCSGSELCICRLKVLHQVCSLKEAAGFRECKSFA